MNAKNPRLRRGAENPRLPLAAVPGGFDAAVPGGFDAAVPGGFDAAVPGGFDAAVPGGFDAAVLHGEHSIEFRSDVAEQDTRIVREITESTGFFYPDEVDTAVELVEDRLAKGLKCGYHFLFAEQDGKAVGYTSFGPIACTRESFDLYWIVVARDFRGKGLGTRLLEESEHRIAALGGTRVYIETSARPLYEPTRAFYLARGYSQVAMLPDYYAPGDAKVIYLRVLTAGAAARQRS